MGFFFKAIAAIVAADAIDRQVRSRPTRYWYPSEPGLPPPGSQMPFVEVGQLRAAPQCQTPMLAWDLERPERPGGASTHR
jgi:hypothetical protein